MGETGGHGPQQMRRRLIERSVEDEAFRERLLSDPKATLEEELGVSLPDGVELKVVEETPETVYLVLPPRNIPGAGGELSDQELETVAGGWGGGGETSGCTYYSTVTCVGAQCEA